MRRPIEAMHQHLSILSTLDTCCTAAYTANLAARGETVWAHASLVVFATTTLLSFCALAFFRERSDPRLHFAILLQLGVPMASLLRLRNPDIHAPALYDPELIHSSWLLPALLAAQAFGGAALHVHVQVLALLSFGAIGITPLAVLSLALAVRTVAAAIVTHNSVSLELLTISSHVLVRIYELCAWSSRLLAFSIFALAFHDGAFALLNDAVLSSVILRLLFRRQACSWAAWGEEYTRAAFTTLLPVWLHYGEYGETMRSNVALAVWLSCCEVLAVWLALSRASSSALRLGLCTHMLSLSPELIVEYQDKFLSTLPSQFIPIAYGLLATLTLGKLYSLCSVASRFYGLRHARHSRSLVRRASWEANDAMLRQAALARAGAPATADGGGQAAEPARDEATAAAPSPGGAHPHATGQTGGDTGVRACDGVRAAEPRSPGQAMGVGGGSDRRREAGEAAELWADVQEGPTTSPAAAASAAVGTPACALPGGESAVQAEGSALIGPHSPTASTASGSLPTGAGPGPSSAASRALDRAVLAQPTAAMSATALRQLHSRVHGAPPMM